MTTLTTALNGAAAIASSAAPTMGQVNWYNATAGALTPTLPALSGLNVGAYCAIGKYTQDTSLNTVTISANGADTFDDTVRTSVVLTGAGEKITLAVVTISGTKYWSAVDGFQPKSTGIAASAAGVSLTNSSTNTVLISATLPNGAYALAAGSTYRIKLMGTIQSQATSGTLTFTPSIQGTALAQTAVMASTTSSNAASPFVLDYLITVRTTGTSGTAIASPYGIINLATTGVVYLTSTSSSTTTVNTTTAAGSAVIQVAAQWATASATNTLTVQNAIIERII